MTTNFTGSKFRTLVNMRKHHNSPMLGVELFGGVEWHDGQLNLSGVVNKIIELVESETAEYEVLEAIQITLCKK